MEMNEIYIFYKPKTCKFPDIDEFYIKYLKPLSTIPFFNSRFLDSVEFKNFIIVKRIVMPLSPIPENEVKSKQLQEIMQKGEGKVGILKPGPWEGLLILVEKQNKYFGAFFETPFVLLQFKEPELLVSNYKFTKENMSINNALMVSLKNTEKCAKYVKKGTDKNKEIQELTKKGDELKVYLKKLEKVVIECSKKAKNEFRSYEDAYLFYDETQNLIERMDRFLKAKTYCSNTIPTKLYEKPLPRKYTTSTKGTQTNNILMLCVKCGKELRSVLNFPCRHVLYCTNCWEMINNNENVKICDKCLEEIKKNIILDYGLQ